MESFSYRLTADVHERREEENRELEEERRDEKNRSEQEIDGCHMSHLFDYVFNCSAPNTSFQVNETTDDE
ncbi:hypothetical protein LXL04_034544 [Taraxacum kok-saghyz]